MIIAGVEYTEEQNDERISLVMEIMCLAYLFQQRTSHCVFVNYSGHVDSLSIEVRNSPEDYQTELAECQFYTDGRWEYAFQSEDDPNYWLKVKRDVLKKALEDRKIPYDMMEKVVKRVIEVSEF